MARTIQSLGEVAERSIAADCKSAVLVATEVRTLPSPPTFSPRPGARLGRDAKVGGGCFLAASRAARDAAVLPSWCELGGDAKVVGRVRGSASATRKAVKAFRQIAPPKREKRALQAGESGSAKAGVTQW